MLARFATIMALAFVVPAVSSQAQTLAECAAHQTSEHAAEDETVNADVVKCRLAGLEDDTIRESWPSVQTPIQISFSPGFSPSLENRLNTELHACFNQFRRLWPVLVPDTVRFVLARDKTKLNKMTKAALGPNYFFHADAPPAGNACNDGANGMAFASNSTVSICVGAEAFWSGLMDQGGFCPLIVHELTHVVQNQLLGFGSAADDVGYVKTRGPVWITEGAAVFLEYGAQMGMGSRRMAHLHSVLDANLPDGTLELSELEGLSALRTGADSVYLQGFRAMLDLAERTGAAPLTHYFGCLGQTHDWESCFSDAFGQSPKTFYEKFAQ